VKTFTTTIEIERAIGWELYKSSLADKLLDRAAEAPDCPKEITESAWTGEVEVKGSQFVVTLIEGEQE
jgi:hypothetical protein